MCAALTWARGSFHAVLLWGGAEGHQLGNVVSSPQPEQCRPHMMVSPADLGSPQILWQWQAVPLGHAPLTSLQAQLPGAGLG